jgi:hypothetical protein
MNKQQARHAHAMARKIEDHLAAMQRRMASIQRERLDDISTDIIVKLFDELPGHWRNIERVITDMMPDLEEK